MAKIIKEVLRPHPCHVELAQQVELANLWVGSQVQCSCGQMFRRADDQRDGLHWVKFQPTTVVC